ncbi:MAG: MarR family transcriptional regulator [Proteobacteria bacterium]|nr:MarR family transcriptional regulator [Pseudomonadota bacterium]
MEPLFIIHLIARIHEQFNKNIIQELKNHNINDLVPSHGDILYVLSLNSRLTMNELAKSINRSKPTVTILTRKLETTGYIRKTGNENDTRSFFVELTEKGKNLIPILYKISEKIIKKTFAGMNDQQKSSGMEFLFRIKNNL